MAHAARASEFWLWFLIMPTKLDVDICQIEDAEMDDLRRFEKADLLTVNIEEVI